MTEVKKKKPVNGRAKGHGFENTIAKQLSEAFAPLTFKRTQMSGAMVGGMNARFNSHYSQQMLTAFVSDIFPSNEDDVAKAEGWRFRFTCECKFYKEPDTFASLFKNPQVKGWWEQATSDAAKLNDKEPLLIFKWNHTPIFIGFDPEKVEVPPTLDKCGTVLSLNYDQAGSRRQLAIVPLLEALKDPDWWKLHENLQP